MLGLSASVVVLPLRGAHLAILVEDGVTCQPSAVPLVLVGASYHSCGGSTHLLPRAYDSRVWQGAFGMHLGGNGSSREQTSSTIVRLQVFVNPRL